MAYTTRLNAGTGNFANMMEKGFGIVTVMNAHIYKALSATEYAAKDAYTIVNEFGNGQGNNFLCTLDSLKVANVTMEGPSKTVTGGRYSNPLIKFGKTARLEMQDALGRSEALEALCGAVQEFKDSDNPENIVGLHFGEDFSGPLMIIGDTFFIDRETGKQVKVKIIFYQVLPDSIFNLTQDAEGDATVFDMNGDLLTTEILVAGGSDGLHGVFYSIVDPNHAQTQSRLKISKGGVVTLDPGKEADEHIFYEVSNEPGVWKDGDSSLPTLTNGQTVKVRVVEGGAIKAVYTGKFIQAA